MILILGGTAEARALATALVGGGIAVLSSLAGRVADPALPVGPVRIGGFGGVDGLVAFLIAHRIEVVVDATHPFAARISANAGAATAATGARLLRLVRPGWESHPDAARWSWVGSTADVLTVGAPARRPFLTTGRQSLAEFLPWADRQVVARVVDSPDVAVPGAWTVIRSRGPYDLASERGLMRQRAVDLLVTKDSGGTLTSAKLDAAAELGVPVVVIRRPTTDPAAYGSVEDVLTVLGAR